NWRPTLSPLSGVRMMNSRPGIVISSENAKYQRRLPMMSNTLGLAAEGWPAGAARHELLVGHAVEPRLASPRPGHDEPEDRPGHDDRAEHRHEHADDQDEREAADHGRPEEVQDRRRDQARHVRVEDRVPGSAEAGLDGRGQGLAQAHLLFHPLEDQDVGVD